MYIQRITLESLLEIAEKEGDVRPDILRPGQLSMDNRDVGTLSGVWREQERPFHTFPLAIIVDGSRHRAFLAWTATYLPQLKPFTAFCRVVTIDQFHKLEKNSDDNKVPSLGLLEEACLGLLLGELCTLTAGGFDIRGVSLAACESTLSYTIMRQLALGLFPVNPRKMRELWLHARRLLKQQIPQVDTALVETPWTMLLQLAGQESTEIVSVEPLDSAMRGACKDILDSGNISALKWRELTVNWKVMEIDDTLARPREERVIQVRRLLEMLAQDQNVNVTMRSFIAGYLVNQVGPGSFEHFGLMVPFLSRLPGGFLWYGLCAGLRRKSYLRNFAGSMGRRVLRDVLRRESILDQPRCDISISELEMLASSVEGKSAPRMGNSGITTVEVSPFVTVSAKSPSRDPESPPSKTEGPQQRELFVKTAEQAAVAYSQLLEAFQDIDEIRNSLVRGIGPAPDLPAKGKTRRRNQ